MIFQNIELKVRILWHFTTRIFVLTPKTVSYAVHSFICVKISLSEEKRKLNVRATKKFSNFPVVKLCDLGGVKFFHKYYIRFVVSWGIRLWCSKCLLLNVLGKIYQIVVY